MKIDFVCGSSRIFVNRDGEILLSGVRVKVEGKDEVVIVGGKIKIN